MRRGAISSLLGAVAVLGLCCGGTILVYGITGSSSNGTQWTDPPAPSVTPKHGVLGSSPSPSVHRSVRPKPKATTARARVTTKPKPTEAPAHTAYANCTALRKDFPSGVQRGHWAYQAKLDRDHDGWACEQ